MLGGEESVRKGQPRCEVAWVWRPSSLFWCVESVNSARDVQAVGVEFFDLGGGVEWNGNASLCIEEGQSDDD